MGYYISNSTFRKFFGKVYERVWFFYTDILCDFYIKFITEGVNILFRSAKQAYLLRIHTPCDRCFLNLPHGVCGIQLAQ